MQIRAAVLELVSYRLGLDEIERAFELMQSGDALRVVLDLSSNGGP